MPNRLCNFQLDAKGVERRAHATTPNLSASKASNSATVAAPWLAPARHRLGRTNVAPRRGAGRLVAIEDDVARILSRATGARVIRDFGIAPPSVFARAGSLGPVARAVGLSVAATTAAGLARAGSLGPGPRALGLAVAATTPAGAGLARAGSLGPGPRALGLAVAATARRSTPAGAGLAHAVSLGPGPCALGLAVAATSTARRALDRCHLVQGDLMGTEIVLHARRQRIVEA